MTASAPSCRTIATAYECASGQIALARALVANGAEVDLAPIRPAIRDLCDVLKSLPKNEAAEWLAQLIELQHELARLGQEFVARAGSRPRLASHNRRTRRMTVTDYLQFVVALLFVLALIGVATLLARRFGLGHAPRPTSRKRRLAIEEILPLDGKRRLVLIRRDAVEHLVLLGASSEIVVERGITRKNAFQAVLHEQAIATSHPKESQ